MTEPPDDGAPNADQATQAQSGPQRSAETIGPYRLLQRVGEGGMGEVWLAEQTRPVHRQVALKIIKAGMDTAHVVARFEAERQALAVMDHPAIARVFDAGATPQGRPYFVMEYVRGEGITSYCNKHKLSVRDRIDLFLQVCDGVQHAHQKGIIHRDLKPSNILVTVQDDHPVPKIIDFGVAKATTQSLTDRTLYTELGVMIGTPEYMSPEQAEMTGLDIDTRTDVYALGVVLYELLTGVLPFDSRALHEQSLDEIRRTIREVDPPRPSIRLTAFAAGDSTNQRAGGIAVAKELRGDLDWITMRALEKDRTRRYGSVSDFAADLRRYLDNLPVLASPPSTVYRMTKFARRHRLGVAAATAFVLLLVAFAATMALQARRIARERDRSNREAAAAKQASDFLVGLFKVSDPSEARGSAVTARQMLDKGAREIEQTLAAQPQLQARLQATMGNVYTSLGIYRVAEQLLQQALATQRRVLGPDDADVLATMNGLANVYWFQHRFQDAERLYLDVIATRRRVLGEDHPDTLRAQFDLASAYGNMGQEHWNDAERLARATLERQQRVLGPQHPDTLGSMNNLATVYFYEGRYLEAEPLYVQILDAERRQEGNDHPNTLLSMHNLANNEAHLERYRDAESLFLQTIDRKCRVLGDDHPLTAWTKVRFAAMYYQQRRYSEAEPLDLSAYQALVSALGSTDPRTETAVRQLIDLYETWGKPTTASEWRAKLPKEPSVPAAAR